MKRIMPELNLSPLKQDVLKIIWPDKKLRVRQIYKILSRKRKVALSSIAVILDRLYEKNIVDRSPETARGGTRYVYFPKKNKEEFEKSIIETTVNKLIEKFGRTAVSYFDERFSKGGK
ncbi:MAG: BlaI/MecI/CopY family transcriptional regulator [Nanoarchaeota archaeon]